MLAATEADIAMAKNPRNVHGQDANLAVRFYVQAIENLDKSKAEGRPIFDEVEMIRIAVPGQIDRVERPVWDGDKKRFPVHYAHFKSGAEAAETGTPLSVWTAIKVTQVAELAARGVRTVEQLAGMADVDAQKFMGMHALREAAKDFLEAAKGSAHLTQMRAELESRDAALAAQKSAHDAELAALKADMARLLQQSGQTPTPVEAAPRSHRKQKTATAD